MKTLEIEIALMKYYGTRQNMIVPNISWGIHGLHECDLLVLSTSNYATEIEIKVSKADLLKDGEKKHGHQHNYITNFLFCVPDSLKDLALKEIPDRAGLLIVKKIRGQETAFSNIYEWRTEIELIKGCTRNKNGVKWTEKDRYDLARLGTLRILGLKEKILNLTTN